MALLFLVSCASPVAVTGVADRVALLLPADALLLGEQHDAPSHPQAHANAVHALLQRGALAAVVLEMADRGQTTAALDKHANETAVRDALGWNDNAWPWANYRQVVMTAVRGGVPVLGGNLPRTALRTAMADTTLDQRLQGPSLKAQQQAIRLGHCNALPESQITPMTRVQVARDLALAQTLQAAARPGKTVVMVAGAGHVDAALGVPQHLPPGFRWAVIVWPPVDTGKDYCAALRR
jgi:uncharacterized iron-regulated protein